MTARTRLLSTATDLACCGLLVAVFEVVFSVLVGVTPPLGYLLLVLSLTCGAAILLTPWVLLPRASASLPLAIFAAWVLGTGMDAWLAILGGVGVWLLAGRAMSAGLSGLLVAISLGVALPFSLLVSPRVVSRVGLGSFEQGLAGPILVLAALLICFAVQMILISRGGRGGATRVAILVALLPGLTAMAPLLTRGQHPENRMPVYEADTPRGSGASVLLLVLDTVRADHLSIYGYERETTPELSRFLQDRPQTALYDMAFAPGTWTLPSHASLFTGLLPSQHNAHEGVMYREEGTVRRPRLKAEETLAELAKRNGYRTAAVLSNTVSLRAAGMRRGFDWAFKPLQERRFELLGERLRHRLIPMVYDYVSKPGPNVYRINELILQYMDSVGDAPFLIVGNYAEAHIPYAPRPPFSGRYTEAGIPNWGPPQDGQSEELMEYLEARYDEEILALDSGLGELFESLEERGALDDTWVIITSDHGEAFGEHGVTEHGTGVYNEVTRIPLLISPPKGESLDPTAEAVSLVDVTALISAVIDGTKLGVGRDLREKNEKSVVRMEYFGNPGKRIAHGVLASQPGRAVAIGDRKLLMQGDRTELYLLSDDPLEEEDRYQEMMESAQAMAPELPDLIMDEALPETRNFSESEKAELQALGYLE